MRRTAVNALGEAQFGIGVCGHGSLFLSYLAELRVAFSSRKPGKEGLTAVRRYIVSTWCSLLLLVCCSSVRAVDWSDQEVVSYGLRIKEPAIAVGADGTVHVARFETGWEYPSGMVCNRRVAGTWTADEPLSTTLDAMDSPCVTIDIAGYVHVGWASGSLHSYCVRERRWNGWGWSAPSLMVNPSSYPTLASGPGGHVQMFASAYDGIALFRWDGVSWTDMGLISNPAASPSKKSAVVEQYGEMHVAWEDARYGDTEVFYMEWDGTQWNPEVRLTESAGESGDPVIAIGSSGEPCVAWSDARDGSSQHRVYARCLVGGTWLPEVPLSTADAHAVYPAIAVDVFGRVNVAWTEFSWFNPPYYVRIVLRTLVDGTWSDQETVSEVPMLDVVGMSLCGGPDGKLHVVWAQIEGEDYVLLYKQGTPAISAALDPETPDTRPTFLIFPNPSSESVTFELRGTDRAGIEASIVDVTGRTVRRLQRPSGAVEDSRLVWDGIDEEGRAVEPGVYYVRLSMSGGEYAGGLIRIP
jgi:hypothetical protein